MLSHYIGNLVFILCLLSHLRRLHSANCSTDPLLAVRRKVRRRLIFCNDKKKTMHLSYSFLAIGDADLSSVSHWEKN